MRLEKRAFNLPITNPGDYTPGEIVARIGIIEYFYKDDGFLSMRLADDSATALDAVTETEPDIQPNEPISITERPQPRSVFMRLIHSIFGKE